MSKRNIPRGFFQNKTRRKLIYEILIIFILYDQTLVIYEKDGKKEIIKYCKIIFDLMRNDTSYSRLPVILEILNRNREK